ncbi:triose-phosphate isomerase family protein [Spirillospora sp. NPDC029432]|uniref:triose-phosphate isomerase family protein n=1 Tax=Spirillospora sp. NPDC029432 TaxID=3154599 RepID=UPI003456118D
MTGGSQAPRPHRASESTPGRLPPILTVTNTKMGFGIPELSEWIATLLPDADRLARAGLMVLAPFPALQEVGRLLAGSGLAHGAQNLWPDSPACTGEVSGTLLAGLGCAYAMVGHAERRRIIGESDSLIAAKAASAAGAGLVPVLCVGEERLGTVPEAVRAVASQVEPVLEWLPSDAALAVMYEPAWTIGGDRAADSGRFVAVADLLSRLTAERTGPVRFLYGGAVTPGVFTRLAAAARLDGVGLGRAAYDAAMRREVIAEVLDRPPA